MGIDWLRAKNQSDSLTEEEQKIVQLLAERKTQPEIAHALGQHRSMIWRKVQRIKAKLGLSAHI